MLEFLTLFLALTAGPQTLELAAGPTVARVDVQLDGERVAQLRTPEWHTTVDFGFQLRPHELVAVAYDRDGKETSRVQQYVNLPRPRAEARLVLHTTDDGPADSAQLTWSALDRSAPEKLEVLFDGQPLDTRQPERIPLPTYDSDFLHVLSAELDFGDGISARTVIPVGGVFGDVTSTELTAIPVLTEHKPPKPEEMAGWLTKNGQPLQAVAVEHGAADLVVVADLAISHDALDKVANRLRRTRYRAARLRPLKTGDDFLFVDPVSFQPRNSEALEMFPVLRLYASDGDVRNPSHPVELFTGPLLRRDLAPEIVAQQRLADAVAVAGLLAASRNRVRCVLLILGQNPPDASQYLPGVVRHYLRSLHVPLIVWTPEEPAEDAPPSPAQAAWGGALSVYDMGTMLPAMNQLNNILRDQHIVWVAGRHLPNQVALVGGKDMRLAGEK